MNILTSKSIDKGNIPKDISIIQKMFKSLGIEEYEKNTLNYMSEFINSYIIDILKESKKNMILSNREKINIEDVELAVKAKQNLMYRNRTSVSKMKELAEKVNKIPLPSIPETPNVLMPPIENNLLRNNFQIYSEELNRALLDEENKNFLENTSLRPDDINILGNKRKNISQRNDSKNNLNGENKAGTFQKKRRKISLNQAFKKTSQENAKKENMTNNNSNENNNLKINFNLNESNKNNKMNSINNNDDNLDEEIDFDNDNEDIDNNNNNADSTNNLKDEDEEELKGEDEDNGDGDGDGDIDGDDDAEGEEMEGDNENEMGSNNEGNDSISGKINNKKNDTHMHDEDDEEDDYGDGEGF